MPYRAKRPCGHPACSRMVDPALGGLCPHHARHRNRERSRAQQATRGTAHARGYGRQHRKWRTMVLARHPLCVTCHDAGRLEPATVADHIVPLNAGGTWDISNGQGLCVRCHNRKTRVEQVTGVVRDVR